jgi:hypothetical protein
MALRPRKEELLSGKENYNRWRKETILTLRGEELD